MKRREEKNIDWRLQAEEAQLIEQLSHGLKFEGLSPALTGTWKKTMRKRKKKNTEYWMWQAAEAQSIEQLASDFKFESLTPIVTCTKRK